MKRVARKWKKISEGECYAVPLRDGGYGIGVIARVGKRGALLGYFFGPRHTTIPTSDDVHALRADHAVLCELLGDLGIQRTEWPYIGRVEPWDRSQWPLPKFGRIEDEARGIAWIVSYMDKDVSVRIEERRCTIEEARRLLPDTTAGYGAVEIELGIMLSDKSTIDNAAN